MFFFQIQSIRRWCCTHSQRCQEMVVPKVEFEVIQEQSKRRWKRRLFCRWSMAKLVLVSLPFLLWWPVENGCISNSLLSFRGIFHWTIVGEGYSSAKRVSQFLLLLVVVGAVQSMLESLSICWIAPAKQELVTLQTGFYQYSTKQPLYLVNLQRPHTTTPIPNPLYFKSSGWNVINWPDYYIILWTCHDCWRLQFKPWSCHSIHVACPSFSQDITWPGGRKGMGPTASWEIVGSSQGRKGETGFSGIFVGIFLEQT